MDDMNGIFDLKSPNFQKLVRYGFTKNGETYTYSAEMMDGTFALHISVSESGAVKTQVIDLNTDEPYTLHLVAEADGAFVGAVRAEYERVLNEIAEACFEQDVFKSDCARKVIKYISETYGDEPEFLWEKFPTDAIWRRKDNKKWYGIIMTISKRKLGLDSDEIVTVIDLRIDPEVLPAIADGKRYFPGYHMNKKSWFTMCLDGSVSVPEIFDWIDKSYILAAKK